MCGNQKRLKENSTVETLWHILVELTQWVKHVISKMLNMNLESINHYLKLLIQQSL